MICRLLIALIIALVVVESFRMQSNNRQTSLMKMSLHDHKEELAKNAAFLTSPGNVHFM